MSTPNDNKATQPQPPHGEQGDRWEPLRSKLTIREAQYLNEYAKTGDSAVLNALVIGIIAQRDALQAQRDELLAALRKTAGYCKTQADFNSDEAALWSQCQQIADAAIARATEGQPNES